MEEREFICIECGHQWLQKNDDEYICPDCQVTLVEVSSVTQERIRTTGGSVLKPKPKK